MQPSNSDWAAAFALFDQALDLEAQQREHWLGSLSGPDPRVLVLLRELLAHHDQIEHGGLHPQLLTRVDLECGPPDPLSPGGKIGPYMLIERLGVGGMGSVWLAERLDKLLDRKVALKLPHTGWAMPDFAARLRHERQLLSSLEHPRIARLYDAGIDADGRPWLALEVVRGEPINAYCNQKNLSIRERLKLVLQVAQAVAYAHTRLIVHRDLKPSNILVDSQGEVHLLDFGIGKLLDPAQPDDGATRFGSRAFTPDYGSPEQLRGDPVTTATDIYSLGVVLYELLTGQRPHRRTAEISIEHAVATVEPQPPSQMTSVGVPKLSADLDAIVLESLEKNPAQRYLTIAAFADDIERYLRGDPVHARRGSSWYRATKFVRRHWTGVVASVLVLTAIIVSSAVSIWQAREARTAAARAEAVEKFLVSIFQQNSRDQPDPLKARATTARELLDAGAARLHSSDLPANSRDGLRSLLGNLYAELGMFKEAVVIEEERVASMRARGLQSQEEFGMALVELGASLQNTGRGDEALRVLREAEDVAKLHPQNRKLLGYVSSNLANQLVYTNSGEALRYARQAVGLLRTAEPRGDEMLGALIMIANTERTVDPEAAEIAGIQALDLIRETRGDRHQLYAQTALMLAEIQSGRMEDSAETTFKAAQSVALATTEPGHFLRLQEDLRYGLMEVDQSRFDEGFTRLKRALADATAAGGRDDVVYVAWAHENLARAYWRRGNLEEAEREATETLRVYGLHARDERYAKSADVAFDIALERGDLTHATECFNESRALREKSGSLSEPGFREQVLFRAAQLDLAQGQTQKALLQFTAIANTPVPGLLRFLEVKLRSRVGSAQAARRLGDNARAAKEARAALGEAKALGDRLQLRQVSAQAWSELAAAEAADGHCDLAHAAQEHATNLLDATDGPDSFRFRWVPKLCD
jgi:serine/threonine protein kinase